jgi:hypothetical protein
MNYTFGSFKGLFQTVKAMLFDKYEDKGATDLLASWETKSHEVPMVFVPAAQRNAAKQKQGVVPVDTVAEPVVAHINPDDQEHAAGTVHERLQGWTPELTTEAEVRDAIEKAFDYRGDVTITRKDGSPVAGYLYDRQFKVAFEECFVRIIPLGKQEKEIISYADVLAIAFTGKDTAAGKTFENWVKRYWEKKAAGEKDIQIEPEYLGD